MGVAFALGFFFILLLIISVISIGIGTVVLIIRYIKKRKTQKKYKCSKIFGIVFLTFGILAALIPIILGIFVGTGFVKYTYMQNKHDKYFMQYENTSIEIAVEEESIRDGKIYLEDSFEIHNKEYRQVDGLSVDFKDIYLGNAVANLNDGNTKLTVYEYLYPENCELLCAGNRIYCTDENIDELIKFYNSESDFTYQYKFINHASPTYVYMEIEDDMFFGLINLEREYVTNTNSFFNCNVEYYIIQTTKDKKLERTLEILIDDDGTIIADVISNPLSNNNNKYLDSSYKYVVTNPEALELLNEIGNKVKMEKEAP